MLLKELIFVFLLGTGKTHTILHFLNITFLKLAVNLIGRPGARNFPGWPRKNTSSPEVWRDDTDVISRYSQCDMICITIHVQLLETKQQSEIKFSIAIKIIDNNTWCFLQFYNLYVYLVNYLGRKKLVNFLICLSMKYWHFSLRYYKNSENNKNDNFTEWKYHFCYFHCFTNLNFDNFWL